MVATLLKNFQSHHYLFEEILTLRCSPMCEVPLRENQVVLVVSYSADDFELKYVPREGSHGEFSTPPYRTMTADTTSNMPIFVFLRKEGCRVWSANEDNGDLHV